jgi:hypothetical protein
MKCLTCKTKEASFGLEGGRVVSCKGCKTPEMIDLKSKKCIVCKKVASFGIEGGKATHCATHKSVIMINVKSRNCEVCKKTKPTYGFEGKIATHCAKCKTDEMIHLRTVKKCILCKKSQPSFGVEGIDEYTHCAKCKTPDMINLRNKKCIVCKKIEPVFGLVDGSATHCASCKETNMINLKDIRCTICNKVYAIYGYEKQKPTHCFTCKAEDMLNLKDKKCIVCKITCCNFGYEGGRPSHCLKCKLEGMVNVRSQKCQICGIKQPRYGILSPTHCLTCKEINMVDLVSDNCELCNTRTYYGYPLNKATRCYVHRLDNMIKNPMKKCIVKDCKKKAEFGIKETYHCLEHKQLDEISLVERKCIKCETIDIVNEECICINFCIMDEKYKIYKRYTKKDEIKTIEKLKSVFGEPMINNKTIDTSCGLEKPDCVYDFETHICIIEIDEKQHRYYDSECERRRMINIVSSFGGIPVYFIRYNPNDWKVKGVRTTLRKQNKEDVLVKWVQYIKDLSEDMIKNVANVKYLYYDEFDKYDKRFDILDYKV